MAKFLRNIALLLLPVVLYFGIFVAFEPNNYFGLKASADGTNIIATLRQYEKQPQNRIILGDSRTAKFDTEQVKRITGQDWTNLSYGGASLKEQLDLADWALDINPNLEEIVFGLTFYTLNNAYSHDRNVISALNNPFVYMTNLGYNMNMLTNLSNHLRGVTVGDKGETMDPADYEYVPYHNPVTGETVSLRKTVADHLAMLSERVANWSLNEKQLARLEETIATCQKRGICFSIVFTPVQGDLVTQVMEAYGIGPQMLPVLQRLQATGATVLDYELTARPALTDDQFYDGFHLDEERGLPAFTEILFTDLQAAGCSS